MKAKDLKRKFNEAFGLDQWPKTYPVNHNTYANVCQFIFESKIKNDEHIAFQGNVTDVAISLGPNNGILFKGVELILQMETSEKKEEKKDE